MTKIKTKTINKKVTIPNKKELREKKLTEALYKKAIGYSQEEIVEEYAKDKENLSELILSKRKVTLKTVPPDISAVKTLLEMIYNKKTTTFENLSDEELEKEKIKLLKLLKEIEKE